MFSEKLAVGFLLFLSVPSAFAQSQNLRTPTPQSTKIPDLSKLQWRDGYIDGGRFVKAAWRIVEASNGSITALDMKSLVRDQFNGSVYVVAYLVEGDAFVPGNLRGFRFDCKGHYTVQNGITQSPPTYAPPRSVAAQLSNIACAKSEKPKSSSEAVPEARIVFYESRYLLAGFLLRAGKVCESDEKRMIEAGFGLLGMPELKAISKAYPQRIAAWMENGSSKFNAGVMTDGVRSACDYALKITEQAESIAAKER